MLDVTTEKGGNNSEIEKKMKEFDVETFESENKKEFDGDPFKSEKKEEFEGETFESEKKFMKINLRKKSYKDL